MAVTAAEYPKPDHYILHFSDTHFVGDDALLYGSVDAEGHLAQILDELDASGSRPEAIVFTGDLADRGDPRAYEKLRRLVEPAAASLGAQLIWVMGNHDNRAAFRAELLGQVPSMRPVDRVYDVNGLRVIALDSTVPGAHHGEVSPEQLELQIERIHAANLAIDGIELLAGSEVNILPDGSLDYPDELLARLDWVIASVHSSFRMDEQAMTDRIVAAIEHPWVDAIGHLTGRKIERRPPYAVDVGRVIEAAARTGTMLEINAAPDRRDLNDVHARAAAQAGAMILVDTDAHRVATLRSSRRYGIATARRAWLTAEQVANTRPWAEFAPLRKRARGGG